jgi:hypothetical protein
MWIRLRPVPRPYVVAGDLEAATPRVGTTGVRSTSSLPRSNSRRRGKFSTGMVHGSGSDK